MTFITYAVFKFKLNIHKGSGQNVICFSLSCIIKMELYSVTLCP